MPERAIDLSLVLACYNEQDVFEQSVRQIVETLDHTTFSYEIIFVDDCSKDNTRELIEEAMRQYPHVQMVRLYHDSNQGRGGTVADGFRLARGQVAGYIDIDLEVHARYIPACVLAVEQGADVVVARRIYQFQLRSLNRYLMSHGYGWLVRHLLPIHADTESGFKFFRRDKLTPLLAVATDPGWFWDTEIMVHSFLCGYRIVEIPCLFLRRFDKRSTVKPVQDTVEYLIKLWHFRRTIAKLGPTAARP